MVSNLSHTQMFDKYLSTTVLDHTEACDPQFISTIQSDNRNNKPFSIKWRSQQQAVMYIAKTPKCSKLMSLTVHKTSIHST